MANRFGRKIQGTDAKRWRRELLDIYERMRSARTPYVSDCDGLRVVVCPDVYAPRFFTDSVWFARTLPEIVGTKSLLEIGCGTGIVSLACTRNGAAVVATDINPNAARNARKNAEALNLPLEVLEGSIYEPIAAGRRFDHIFWAHPFNNANERVEDWLLRSGFDYHYEGMREFIEGARRHLTDEGRLLLGSGDTADLSTIEEIAEANDYRLNVLRHQELPLQEGSKSTIVYLILEFEPTSA